MDEIQKLADRIRAEIPIADIVTETLPLEAKGERQTGYCPFHEDTRPSLIVDPSANSWQCWPCNSSGDSISFWMKKNGLEFSDAVSQLAKRLDH